jgi:glycosyltransferase involved in cell wall biosynthesis
MRVAQIAPLYERVPPKLYGGTERIVHTLCEELVELGHDVTLFASRDSLTSARLVPMVEAGTRLGGARDPIALHIAMLEEVYARADEFDIIHSHVDVLAFPFARASTTPTVSTMHGRLDLPEQARVLSRFHDLRLISISERQREPVAGLDLNWTGTVHNGITLEHFPFSAAPADPPYLVFLGRISPEKGPHHAIEIARRCGLPLKIAAKIEYLDEVWARQHFLPLLDTPGVEFFGEVDEPAKVELLAGATALLFPIDWPEPFGIVLVESMACGTPVVALRGGSVEEVLVDGETGYVCSSLDEMVDAVHRVDQLDRADCRRRVEERFSGPVMAAGYERLYRQVLLSERLPRGIAPVLAADGPIGSLLPGTANGDAAISDLPVAGEA